MSRSEENYAEMCMRMQTAIINFVQSAHDAEYTDSDIFSDISDAMYEAGLKVTMEADE